MSQVSCLLTFFFAFHALASSPPIFPLPTLALCAHMCTREGSACLSPSFPLGPIRFILSVLPSSELTGDALGCFLMNLSTWGSHPLRSVIGFDICHLGLPVTENQGCPICPGKLVITLAVEMRWGCLFPVGIPKINVGVFSVPRIPLDG